MNYKLQDKVYHPCDAAPFIVTKIDGDRIRIKGDWSGGTHSVNENSWVNVQDIKLYDESKVTVFFSEKPYRMVVK